MYELPAKKIPFTVRKYYKVSASLLKKVLENVHVLLFGSILFYNDLKFQLNTTKFQFEYDQKVPLSFKTQLILKKSYKSFNEFFQESETSYSTIFSEVTSGPFACKNKFLL